MHIAIVGNIGAGKTTLTELLAKNYGWDPLYEAVDHNPYLEDFYNDMKRWSFNLQIYFLNSRYRQLIDIQKDGRNVIQDRTIYEDAFIFAENLHDMGLMTTRIGVHLPAVCAVGCPGEPQGKILIQGNIEKPFCGVLPVLAVERTGVCI